MVARTTVDNIKIKAKAHAKDLGKWASCALNKEKESHAKKVKKMKTEMESLSQDHLSAIKTLTRTLT